MQQWMFAVDYKSVRFGGTGGSIYQLSLNFNAHTFGKRLRARGSHGLVTLLCSRVMLIGRAVAKVHKESSSGEHSLAIALHHPVTSLWRLCSHQYYVSTCFFFLSLSSFLQGRSLVSLKKTGHDQVFLWEPKRETASLFMKKDQPNLWVKNVFK